MQRERERERRRKRERDRPERERDRVKMKLVVITKLRSKLKKFTQHKISFSNTSKISSKRNGPNAKEMPTTGNNVTVVHCKFASEDDSKTISITLPSPASVQKVCEAFLSERSDVQQLIQKKGGTFEGFAVCALPTSSSKATTTLTTSTKKTKKEEEEDEKNQTTIYGLSGSEASTILDDAKVLENNDRITMALTKEYNLKSLNPVRKYTIGSFHGTNLPKFKSGKQAAVEWQMRRTIDEANPTVASGLSLVGGKRQAFIGAKEKGQSAKFYILKAQNTNDFCALPMETWYNFKQLMSRKVLNLEEAEELMKNKQDRLYETSAKFVGSRANDADLDRFSDSDSEEDIVNPKSRRNRKRGEDTDDEDEENEGKKKGRKRGGGGGKKKGEEDEMKEKNEDGIGEGWEHDQTYSDDEGGEVMTTADPEQQEIDKQNAPKPPTADSDDELDENAQKIKTLLTRQNAIEKNVTAAAIFSDDDDDDDDDDIPEDFDPDKEEVNIAGSLVNKVKQKEKKDQEAAKAAAAAAKEAAAEEQRRALAQQQQLQQQQLQQQQGVKRTASQAGMTSQENSARKSVQRPLSRGVSAPGGGGDKIKDESATNPIEKIIRDLLNKNPGRTTMKDITKACRKAGLVSSDAGKAQLKATIERILKFSQTSDGVMVVALK